MIVTLLNTIGNHLTPPDRSVPKDSHLWILDAEVCLCMPFGSYCSASPGAQWLPVDLLAINQMIAMAVNVPIVQCVTCAQAPDFDPVLTTHHLPTLRQIRGSGRETLICTPWRSGVA